MAKARTDSFHDARNLPIFVIEDALIDTYGAQIGAYGVAVYTTLARFAKRDHATILAYQTIADALKLGKTTVRTTLKSLERAGIIRIEQQTDDSGVPIASNRYTLLPIGDSKAASQPGGGIATRQGVAPHDTPPSSGDTPMSPHDSPYRDTHGGVSPHAYIDKYQHGGGGDHGGGDRARAERTINPEFVRQLCLRRAQGKPMSPKSAENIARRVLTGQSDEQTILTSLDALIAADTGMGAIVDLLNSDATIPPKGQPYESLRSSSVNGTDPGRNGTGPKGGRADRAAAARAPRPGDPAYYAGRTPPRPDSTADPE